MEKSALGPSKEVSIETQRPQSTSVESVENRTRAVAAEAIIAWQTEQIRRLLSVLTAESQSRNLKVMGQLIERAKLEYRYVAVRGVPPESYDLFAREFQDEFEKLSAEIKRKLGM